MPRTGADGKQKAVTLWAQTFTAEFTGPHTEWCAEVSVKERRKGLLLRQLVTQI